MPKNRPASAPRSSSGGPSYFALAVIGASLCNSYQGVSRTVARTIGHRYSYNHPYGWKLADALLFTRDMLVNKGADHDRNILFTHPAQPPCRVSRNWCR